MTNKIYFLRRLSGAFAVCGLAVMAFVQPEAAEAQSRQISINDGTVSKVVMAAGRTLTIETDKPFSDILIGNPAVIDVFPLSDNSLYIQSKTFGITNVTLYSEDKKLLEVVDVKVEADFSDLSTAISAAVPSAHIKVTNVNNRVRLSGEVKDSVDQARALEIASQFTDQPVINAIRVIAEQQVELDVRIIEVARNSGRELGVNLDATRNGSTVGYTTATANDTPFGVAIGELLEVSGVQVDFLISALEDKGLARRLANPKLVATSGVEANFVVGGEVPISVQNVDENGSVQYETDYREFGVRLNFMPVVLDNELIRLRITPEVSDIDTSIDVNGNPGFITRRADTTVSLRSGQSFAIAGLLQANNERNISQVPWLGQVPVLGALFRSTRFQKRETDLVILVTPRIVRPGRPGEPLASPLDQTRSSNDVELFLLGMLEVDRQTVKNFKNGVGVAGPYGHIIDLEFADGVITKK